MSSHSKLPPDITPIHIPESSQEDSFPSPISSLSPQPFTSRIIENTRFSISETETETDTRIGIGHSKEEDVVVSAGLIAFSPDFKKILLVRRKDSMAYVEFIRGKYKPKDTKYLQFLIASMTLEEQTLLHMNSSFEELWSKMWIIKTSKSFNKNFEIAKHKFDSCIRKIRGWIPYFQRESIKQYRLEPEWGIPKGRPNRHESNINCALREFEEETGIYVYSSRAKEKEKDSSPFLLEYPSSLHVKPLEIEYIGTNHIPYKIIIYPAICHVKDVGVDPENKHQEREISAVEWVSIEDALERLKGLEIDYSTVIINALKYFRSD
jgi:8-oxo-dGTP pyrophosphatase MutT (NUDIX family)